MGGGGGVVIWSQERDHPDTRVDMAGLFNLIAMADSLQLTRPLPERL